MGAKPRAFKHLLDETRIEQIGLALHEVCDDFDNRHFVKSAQERLCALELKDRVRQVIASLHAALPQPFSAAVNAIVQAVEWDGRLRAGDERWLRGFAAWPLIDYIGEHGLDELELSLSALRRLTSRFSAEFAIRPFLDRYPRQTLAPLTTWVNDPDEHVRRLVSEGTRPLLPWGMHLVKFREDPEPVLALLESLKSDPSEYVRRSVANNLNDISKDHPERVVERCAQWSRDADHNRHRLIKRALRTLVKRGHPGALSVLGFATFVEVDVGNVEVFPKRVSQGEEFELQFPLRSTGDDVQDVLVDYAVHFVKANGSRSPKVFKLKTLRLAKGEGVLVRKKHSMRAVTTRVHYPGTHLVEVLVNGKPSGRAEFEFFL